MCRSIKQLRLPDHAPSDEELRAAALQFVRKVSGYRVPSKANDKSFNCAVAAIAASTRRLLDTLTPPRAASARNPRTVTTASYSDRTALHGTKRKD
jgi:hypothetical protein